ncbi:succinyl-diaminopimelate desuccinylase [Halobacteriales archaeon QS_4_69_34]|nr:MAG: succinyl-diaminopimelate desuccinylase [Halobacteriales archaeon QS_4_69_34]
MRFDAVDFLERAVRTPSNEDAGPMRELLCAALRSHGVEPRVDSAGNVLATQGPDGETSRAVSDPAGGASPGETGEGDVSGPHVVLNTHLDTVSPHVSFEREGDVLRGRGTCDAKGPLAAFLRAFLAAEPERGRLTLAVTPDEETRSTGAAALVGGEDGCGSDTARGDSTVLGLDADRGDCVIVGEPTALDACNAAKGRFEGVIEVRGESAHAAEPASGANAVGAAAPALDALRTFDDREASLAHPALGGPTLTPTRIEGGEATNQVPAACRITIDRRSVPPETGAGFERALDGHLRAALDGAGFGPSGGVGTTNGSAATDGTGTTDRTANGAGGVEVAFRLAERETPFLEAFETPADAPVVAALRSASGGRVRPFAAATEASYFAACVPTVVFGPGALADEAGPVAHADREYVRVPAVEAAADALEAALATLLG